MNKKDLTVAINTIINARKSCKKFNNQIIDTNTLLNILESSNKCPSSFGLQPWKILIVKNQNLKTQIQKFCDNQEQITSCSHLLIVLTYKGKMFEQDNAWMIARSKIKRNLKNEQNYLNFYQKSFLPYMKQINDWDQWAINQSYILLQTILLVATAYNLATATLQGINLNKIINFLETKKLITEKDTYNCPFLIALGYSEEKQHLVTNKNEITEKFIIIE